MVLVAGHCDKVVLKCLLERRGSASISEHSQTRRTALDFAVEHRCSGDIVAKLRILDAKERARTANVRCHVCGDIVEAMAKGRPPKLQDLWDRATREGEGNRLLNQFYSEARFRSLLEASFHQINNNRNVRKELSESMAVLDCLENCCPAFSSAWHVVDLCCGRSVTAALVATRWPGVTVTTIDRLDPSLHPHLAGMSDIGVNYARLDVLGDTFLESLQQLVTAVGRQTVLLGMHLCGNLSLRAVCAFSCMEQVHALVLAPCCLPAKKVTKANPVPPPPHLYTPKSNEEKYRQWALHLQNLLNEEIPQVSLRVHAYSEILSPRNIVIGASK